MAGTRTKRNAAAKDLSALCSSLFHLVPCSKIGARDMADNGPAHSWLKAMKDLSPPRMRCVRADLLDMSDSDVADVRYRAWVAEHPSALDNFNNITEAASGKRIAVFLDYDGTLSPIVEDPEQAFMSDKMRGVVKEIAALFPAAIITGRSREKVYEFVQLPELYYAGSHGMDITGPAYGCHRFKGTKVVDEKGNEMVVFQPACEFALVMNEVFKLLEERAKQIPGAKVEHNKFCISIHFRSVKEEHWLSLAEQVRLVHNLYPNLRLTHGRKILELRPPISWNKGKALDYLIKALGLGSRNDIFPIYIGDDKTDEDAFKVLIRRKIGVSILVSNIVKETKAVCSLREPSEVLEFLSLLVKWGRRGSGQLL